MKQLLHSTITTATLFIIILGAVFSSSGFFSSSALAEPVSTLAAVQKRGYLNCGVTDRMPGFSVHEENGKWTGFNVDFCRALAAATLKDARAVQLASYWLDALVGGDVDVLHAGSTWTLSRDSQAKIEFPGVNFYDGQGFIAYGNLGLKTLKEAVLKKGLKVCSIGTTSTSLLHLQDFISKTGAQWEIVKIRTIDGLWRAFFGGRCDMAIHDRTSLVGIHAKRLKGSSDFVVFPEVISKEPLAPAVRQDDFAWRDLVAWVTFVTISAEELGLTQANVKDMKATSTVPEIRRLLGGGQRNWQGLWSG